MNPWPVIGIYPILDADQLQKNAIPAYDLAQLIGSLNIGMVQLRCKKSGDKQWIFMQTWMEILRQEAPQTKVVVNDRLDIALALEADGLHLGQEDLPIMQARRLLGKERLLGFSTHNLEQLKAAQAIPVDYLGFGPIFTTTSKTNTDPSTGLVLLQQACQESHIPIVAIGGITQTSIAAVALAGATAAAMIAALWNHSDWEQRLRQAINLWPSQQPCPPR